MRRGLFACLVLAACDSAAPRLDLNITSSLEIPRETNAVTVRVEAAGDIEERSYDLGEAPRDRWPQTLPVLSARGAGPVRLIVELRMVRAGQPSVPVGYGELDVTFPASGSDMIIFDVPRNCVDADRDGYGSGFGCVSPDCDDTRSDVPSPIFCPASPGSRDAGVGEDGSVDPADCTTTGCPTGQVCFETRCRESCSRPLQCSNFAQECLTTYGVCVCRVACLFDDGQTCGPLQCIDGCCEL